MKLAAVLAAIVTALLGSLAADGAVAAPRAAERVVLPADVRPERYELLIVPDAERLTFDGHAKITLQVLQPTQRIVLNAADLTFHEVRLSDAPAAPHVQLDEAQQTAAFVFDQPLAPGRHELTIDYSGKIYQQASGLFALDAPGPKGPQRALFTQFENSDARRFAPLWDEPGIKAVFSLTVEGPARQMAVSNMPAAKVAPLPGGRTATTFADTPKMSSYLLFLALGDFERVSRKVGDTDVGVVVRRGEAASAQFALDAATQILPYYNDWFGAPYPLPKLDFIAGPGQSQFFAAMENWGAIFAFDRDLLVDARASDADRQNVYIVIAHEMAHQWFGDLVTMAWWDDIWLNEGFASWMEQKTADRFHPEWKRSLQALAARERAMQVDAAPGTHPVITPIRDVFAASSAFDSITYQKGEAVVRMLEAYVGEDAFRAGIRAYIARNAYANTRTDDLWTELERVSPKPVTAIAHDFTLQSGVPQIAAAPAPGGVRLTQERFATTAAGSDTSWRVPVRVAKPNGETWTGIVRRGQPKQIDVPAGQTPVVNAGQTGYFRTLYEPALWSPLMARYPALAPADQLGLLFDARALGLAGAVPLGDFLELAGQAASAQEPIVVNALVGELVALARYFPHGEPSPAFAAYARARLAPDLARLGWTPGPDELSSVRALRANLIASLAEFDDPAVIAEARRLFASGAVEGLSPDLRYAVQAVVARRADVASWEALRRQAGTASSARDRERLYRLLGMARDPALADRALALALSDEPPATIRPGIIAAVADRYPEKAFDFALAHRAEIEALLEPDSRVIYFANLASGSRDAALIPKLQAYGATIPASSRGEIDKAVGAIQRRKMFAELRAPQIERWLATHR
jgi:aminopeptidase N